MLCMELRFSRLARTLSFIVTGRCTTARPAMVTPVTSRSSKSVDVKQVGCEL